jgi:hypothetical protein
MADSLENGEPLAAHPICYPILGATWFLSFDRNSRQRPLAAALDYRYGRR